MTYKLADKTKRNESLIKFAKAHPDYTLRALAGIYHLSYERVRQLLKGENNGNANTQQT